MRVSFILLLVVVLSLPITTHSRVLCIGEEKYALLDFKQSFGADPDDVLSTWSMDNAECCKWSGVQCDDRTGHVVSLSAGGDLESHELRPSLLVLQHLTSLDLSGNVFNMSIPNFIGSLSNLTSLDLGMSGFYGKIPPHLGNLTKLTSLHLGMSGFYGKIPPHLGNLTKLTSLDLGLSSELYADDLQWLSHLSSLEELELSDVNLSNATDWLSTLKMLPSLSVFDCSSCSLPLVPPISSTRLVNRSTTLQILNLSYNNISYSSFSSMINGTTNLMSVDLAYMNLEQNFHEFVLALIHSARYTLEGLNIDGNNLTRLPPKMMMFPSLKYLFISHNQLRRLFTLQNSPDFSNLTSLIYLNASSNKLNGNLYVTLHHLPSTLESLILSSNSFNHTISEPHVSKFSNLHYLDLSDNYLLNFNFSNNWVPPFQLNSLLMGSCKLGPSFPKWVLTQKSLSYLDISNSSISGAIPSSFWNDSITRLDYLNASNNRIHCTIPNLPPSSLNASTIDLSSNDFHGPIPMFAFSASILLDLSNNKFSSFPTSHHELSNNGLSHINLSNNILSGSLPHWIFRFNDLMILNLANNMVSGTIPSSIGFLWQLNGLHLNNNKFSGELPSSLKNCSQLMILELENNNFSGSVPFWLGQSLSWLVVLSLSSNNLSGDLPSSICHLQHLQALDLSGNRISGSIPSCINNFTSMAKYEGFDADFFSLYDIYLAHHYGHWGSIDYASLHWKGILANESGRILPQLNLIDLSNNCLTGNIPNTVTSLKYLRSLDLSENSLEGSLPDKIGLLTYLEILKLSSNHLCGEIPKSLADLTFLDTLNLSSNTLSGRIPTSTQLQNFDPSSYAGNPELCGQPLPTKCLEDREVEKQPPFVKDDHTEEANEPFNLEAFYAALGTGFAFSFLGILGILNFHARSRHAFFQMASDVADWVYVKTFLCKSVIKTSFCF